MAFQFLLPLLSALGVGGASAAGAGALGAGAAGALGAGAAAAGGAGALSSLAGAAGSLAPLFQGAAPAMPETLGGLIQGGSQALQAPEMASSLLSPSAPVTPPSSVSEAVMQGASGRGNPEGEKSELDKLIQSMAGVKDPGDPTKGLKPSTAAPRPGSPSQSQTSSSILAELLQGSQVNPLPTLGSLIGGV